MGPHVSPTWPSSHSSPHLGELMTTVSHFNLCKNASLYVETFSRHGELETVDKCLSLCCQGGKFWEEFCISQRNSRKINSPPLAIAEALIILPNAFSSSFPISLSPLLHSASWDHLQNTPPAPTSLPQALLLGKFKVKSDTKVSHRDLGTYELLTVTMRLLPED